MANLKFKFNLNEMQIRTGANRGKSMIIDAPTGMGKTEAILNGIKEGSKVAFMLPTKTSAYFMYRRLEQDFDNIDLRINTSSSKLHREVENPIFYIEIFCPDGLGIDYLSNKYKYSNKEFVNPYDIFVLDEFDSYPEMVKTAMLEMMADYKDNQWIIASATLESNFQELLPINFERIIFKQDLDIVKFRADFVHWFDGIDFESLKGKKVGVICNSIRDLKEIKNDYRFSNYFEDLDYEHKVVELHSDLTDIQIKMAEDRLFNGDFELCIATDVIAYSVDVNFDVLFTQMTDNEGTFIQRLGRVNRYNKDVRDIEYRNLFVLIRHEDVPFIDNENARKLFDIWIDDNRVKSSASSNLNMEISYTYVRDRKEQLEINPLPTIQDILEYWNIRLERGFEIGLRKVPIQFKLFLTTNVGVYENGELTGTKPVKTFRLLKFNKGYMPWAWYEYSTYEKAEKDNADIVHLFGQNYIIVGKDGDSYIIEEYNGIGFSHCQNCNEIIDENEYCSGGYCDYCSNDDDDEDWDDYNEYEEDEEPIIQEDDPELTLKTNTGETILYKGDLRRVFLYQDKCVFLQLLTSSISNQTNLFYVKGKWYVTPRYVYVSEHGTYVDGIYKLEIDAIEINEDFFKDYEVYLEHCTDYLIYKDGELDWKKSVF